MIEDHENFHGHTLLIPLPILRNDMRKAIPGIAQRWRACAVAAWPLAESCKALAISAFNRRRPSCLMPLAQPNHRDFSHT
jgi:hypothetical protein